jgi:hypothetical protein
MSNSMMTVNCNELSGRCVRLDLGVPRGGIERQEPAPQACGDPCFNGMPNSLDEFHGRFFRLA